MPNTYTVSANTTAVNLNPLNGLVNTITYTFTRSGDSLGAETIPWSILHSPELYGTLFRAVNGQPFLGNETLFPSGSISFGAGQTSTTLQLGIGDGNFGTSKAGAGYSFGLRLDVPGVVATTISDSATGGFGVTERYYTIQGGSGTLTLTYQMQSIPDRADIYVDGVLAQTTGGPVSGAGSLTVGGSILQPGTSVRVVVTGEISGTVWDYDLNYVPGLSADTAAYVNVAVPDPLRLDLAQLARDVYEGRSTGNDSYVPYGDDLELEGLRVQAYRNADTSEVVFAVRGTHDDNTSIFVKNWLSNSSFATGFSNFSFDASVAATASYVRRVATELSLTGDDITITGHSLGGAIAQVVAQGAGVNAEVYDAPGAGALYAGLSDELAPVRGLGSGGTSTNVRLRGDQVSLVGQSIGTQHTLLSPHSESIANVLANHDLDALINQIRTNASSTSLGSNFASVFTTALDFGSTARPDLAAGAFVLSLAVDAVAQYMLDPDGTTTFELTLGAGSPAFRTITLPRAADVSTYFVSLLNSGVWSAPQALAPGVATSVLTSGAGTTGIRFSATAADGSYTVLPNGFFFQLGFAGSGQAVVNLATRTVSYAHDIDGNRFADLLWQSDGGQAATWLMNAGAIQATGFTGPANGPDWRIAGSGDLNADARADMVWVNGDGQAAVWLSDDLDIYRSATLGEANGPGWRIRAVGDINGDTRDDIVWQNEAGQAVAWYMDGLATTGGVALGTPNGGNWTIRGVADLDGDGRGDLVWQNSAGQAVAWMMNATSIRDAAPLGSIAAVGGADWHIRGFGDFNRDGRDDIVWQNDQGQATVWLMNGASVTGAVAIGGANGPEWNIRQVADLNADGHPDLVWQNHLGQAVEWLLTGINTAFVTTAVGGANGAAWSVVTSNGHETRGDLDGDGRADLVWQNSSGQAVLWRMNGSSIISAEAIGGALGPDWSVRSVDDISGDGMADLIWQNGQGQNVAWIMRGDGIASAAAVGGALGAQWQTVASGDLNGDGMSDLVVQDSSTGQAVVWLMNGAAITTAAAVGGANGADWKVQAAGDMNGDSYDDLIWENAAGQASVWLMRGAELLGAAFVGGANGTGFDITGAGDFDADGRDEIIWQTDNGQAGLWYMVGASIASAVGIGGANGAGWEVADIADFNADGRHDIAWQNVNGQGAVWLMNGSSILDASFVGASNGADWALVG